jgi:hypothetical protein
MKIQEEEAFKLLSGSKKAASIKSNSQCMIP